MTHLKILIPRGAGGIPTVDSPAVPHAALRGQCGRRGMAAAKEGTADGASYASTSVYW